MNGWIWHFSDYWISVLINFDWRDNFPKLHSVHFGFSSSGTYWNSFFIRNPIVLNQKVIKSFLKMHPQPPLNVLSYFLCVLKNITLQDIFVLGSSRTRSDCWHVWESCESLFFFPRIKYTCRTMKWGLMNAYNTRYRAYKSACHWWSVISLLSIIISPIVLTDLIFSHLIWEQYQKR